MAAFEALRRSAPKRPSGSFGTLAAAKRRRQRQFTSEADVVEADIDESAYVEVEVAPEADPDPPEEELKAPTTPEAPPGRDNVAAAFWQDSLEADEDDGLGATPSTEASTQVEAEADPEECGDVEDEELVEVEDELLEVDAEAFVSEAAYEAEAEAFEQEGEEAEAEAFEQVVAEEGDAEAFEAEELDEGGGEAFDSTAEASALAPAEAELGKDYAAHEDVAEDEEEVELEVEVAEEVAAEATEEVEAAPELEEQVPQPQTPQEPPPAEELEGNLPRHRTLPTPALSNFRRRSRNKERRSVSFHKANVPDGYLLDDGTGLRAIHHLLSFRQENLWFINPGASVECGFCLRLWPQAFGKLWGEEGRSQFAQTDFICNSCLEEAARLEQEEAEEEAEEGDSAVPPEQAVGASTGPWDNPQSGWGDWIGTAEE